MSIYLFQDSTIGFYEHRIDLLRNEYNYDSYEYNAIQSITIKRGMIKNWIILFGLGLVFIVSAGLIIYSVYSNSVREEFFRNLLILWGGSRGYGVLAVLFLIAFGIYSVLTSLKKTIKVVIQSKNKSKQYEILQIYKDNNLDALIEFLKERVEDVSISGILTLPSNM